MRERKEKGKIFHLKISGNFADTKEQNKNISSRGIKDIEDHLIKVGVIPILYKRPTE